MKQNQAFDYGDTVRISEHKGRIGTVVSINGPNSSRTYTVEFGDGADSEIDEQLLLREEGPSSPSPA